MNEPFTEIGDHNCSDAVEYNIEQKPETMTPKKEAAKKKNLKNEIE